MSTKRFGCAGIALVLLLCLSLLFNFLFLTSRHVPGRHLMPPQQKEFEEETVLNGTGGTNAKIVLISLHGLISSSISGSYGDTMVDDVKMALRQATDDERIKAIVLNIDSPGGEVTASDVIYNAVRQARAHKPVVIYMGSVAASGGYYIACGGSYLMANETTLTGSIGVIIQTINYQELLGKIGVGSVVFKSGQFKDMLSGARQMTPEEREYIQALVMQTYGKFVQIVADERKIPVEQLRAGIADGRVISGKDALEQKLINQVGQIEDAFEKARELGHAAGATVIKYEAPFRLAKLVRLFGKSADSKLEINLADHLLPQLESGKLYLLPSFYFP
jgi:protease-4